MTSNAGNNSLSAKVSIPGRADGDFGDVTRDATIAFQKSNGIEPTLGIVGNKTMTQAMALGFPALEDLPLPDLSAPLAE